MLATPGVLADIGGAGSSTSDSSITSGKGTCNGTSPQGTTDPAAPAAAPSSSSPDPASAAAAATAATATASLRGAASTAALAAAGGGAAAVAAALAATASSPFRHAIQELLLFFADTYKRVFKFDDPPLHVRGGVLMSLGNLGPLMPLVTP